MKLISHNRLDSLSKDDVAEYYLKNLKDINGY